MSEPTSFGAAANRYVEDEIRGESPLQLIARVYGMAVLEVKRARAAMTGGDWSAKGLAVRRAARCLSLLQCSLNMEQGGEVAANLDRIYAYLLRRLSEAHARNDAAALQEVLERLGELEEAWRQVARDGGRLAHVAAATHGEAVAPAAR